MRRLVNITSLLILVGATATLWWRAQQPAPAIEPASAVAEFSVGATKAITFDVPADTLDQFADDVLDEQLRDWLMYAVISESINDASTIRAALFDLPPMRAGYVQSVAALEFGPTRFRVIDQSGTTVALIPAAGEPGVSEDSSKAMLAAVADAVRAQLGQVPSVVRVFRYQINNVELSAKLTRDPDIEGRQLFTDAYGYVEGYARNAGDLAAFLSQTSDLIGAQRVDGSVRLVGRKPIAPKRNIGIADVAALWQSEEFLSRQYREIDALNARYKDEGFRRGILDPIYDREKASLLAEFPELGGQRLRAEAKLSQKYIDDLVKQLGSQRNFETELQRLLRNSTLGSLTTRKARSADDAVAEFNARWNSEPHIRGILQARFDADAQALARKLGVPDIRRVPSGSGFSLDPAYNYTQLRGLFERLRDDLEPYFAAAELDAIQADLANRRELSFLEAVYELSQEQKTRELADGIQAALMLTSSFQRARYDGPLQGTEVGMVLFYTDLLAKLWALDFEGSAPDHEYSSDWVPGFVPLLKLVTSPIYGKGIEDQGETRLWFGPRESGFTRASDALWFAPIATRVYAAGINSLQPGKEADANAEAEVFLGWWNDHYEQIANFEPEYHRLNEIMKWSIVFGWLTTDNALASMRFLSQTPVDRTRVFPNWARSNRQLKFQPWDEIPFLPEGYEGIETESLQLLHSRRYLTRGGIRAFVGGVSLAERQKIAARLELPRDMVTTLRRSGIESVADAAGTMTMKSLDQAQYRFGTATNQVAALEATAARPLRGADIELARKPFNLEFNRGANALRARLQSNQKAIAEVSVERRNTNDLRLVFKPLDIEHTRAFSKTLSASKDAGRDALPDLAARGDVKTVIQSGDTFFVEPANGAGTWIKLVPEGSPKAEIAGDVDLRYGSLSSSRRTGDSRWNGSVIDAEAVERALRGRGQYLIAAPAEQPAAGVAFSVSTRGPPDGRQAIDLTAGGGRRIAGAIGELRKSNGGSGGTDNPLRGLSRNAALEPSRALVALADTRARHFQQGAALLRSGKFNEARLVLDALPANLRTAPDLQAYRVVAHAASNSPVAAAEAARMVISPETVPHFLRAIDEAMLHIPVASPEHATVDTIARGVVARTAGLNPQFVKTRGELGIEVRLASVGWESAGAQPPPAAAARYSLETIDPNIGGGPVTSVPLASAPIEARLRQRAIAMTQPEVIVNVQTNQRYRRVMPRVLEAGGAPFSYRSLSNCSSAEPGTRPSAQHCDDEVGLVSAHGDQRR